MLLKVKVEIFAIITKKVVLGVINTLEIKGLVSHIKLKQMFLVNLAKNGSNLVEVRQRCEGTKFIGESHAMCIYVAIPIGCYIA